MRMPSFSLRACLKKSIKTRHGRYGVPPLGGFRTAPPKGGTPYRVARPASSRFAAITPQIRTDVTFECNSDSRLLWWSDSGYAGSTRGHIEDKDFSGG